MPGRLSLFMCLWTPLTQEYKLKTEQWHVFLERPHAGVDFKTTSKLTLTPVRRQKIRALYFLKVLVFSEGTFDDIYFFSLYVTYGTSKRSPAL